MLFGRFQRLLGVTLEEELVYHMACFLSTVPVIPEGVFVVSKENIELLHKLARRVLATEAGEKALAELKDDRTFCIESNGVGIPPKEMRALTNKGRRIVNMFSIRKKYDGSKSKRINAEICGVDESSIARYRRVRKDVDKLYEMYVGNRSMVG